MPQRRLGTVDAQAAGGYIAHGAHIEGRVHHVPERRGETVQQPLACLGGRHAARRTIEQAYAQALLQVAHALAQARRRHPLRDGCAPEIAKTSDGDEGGEIAQVDIVHCALR